MFNKIIEQQLKTIAKVHLEAKQAELKGLLSDIKEYDLTTVNQVKGLIHNNLDIVNNLIVESKK